MSPALVQANLLPLNQIRQNADTHVLAPELIVFVNDSQDATLPASAPYLRSRRQIRSQGCYTGKGAFHDHCYRPYPQHQRRREIERDRLTGLGAVTK
jgi:hypothetical protein